MQKAVPCSPSTTTSGKELPGLAVSALAVPLYSMFSFALMHPCEI